MTPAQFSKRMRKLSVQMDEAAKFAIARAALATGTSLILNTPINTGAAKSNWQVSSRPKASIRRAYAKGNLRPDDGPIVDTTAANESAAISALAQAIAGRSKRSRKIHITNNLTYVSELDRFYPIPKGKNIRKNQYRSGFVARAIQEGVLTIRDGNVVKQALSTAGVRMGSVGAIISRTQ